MKDEELNFVARAREAIRRGRIGLANALRRRRPIARFVVLNLSGEIREFPPYRPHVPFAHFFLPPPPTTVSSLRRLFEQIVFDSRIEGIVLRIGCVASAAVYQNLRQLLLDFRAKGKRVVAYATGFGPFQYYLASACDQIVMPPGAEWSVLGLRREYVFLKDALAQVGLSVDVFNVSPFKSAGDQFTRIDFSEESRAQAEWLLEETWRELVRGIAEGRRLSEARVEALINSAPMSARDAVENGLLDAALYEDELEAFLSPASDTGPASNPPGRKARRAAPPTLGLYNDLRKSILVPYTRYADKAIAVIGVEGLIVEGSSQSLPLPLPIPIPFVGEGLAGADTIAQALRHVEQDDTIAAVILHVDSGGGSALASDLIAREVKRVRAKKPVVAYMSGAAASGGYYVSAPANAIIAQSLTITGSIGVIVLRPNAAGLDDRLSLHRAVLQRGARTGLLSASTPLSDDERNAILGSLGRAYEDFKQAVATGRAIDADAIEPLAGGRVWTGRQALERKLVDELGDFNRAVDKARELAGLPPHPRVRAVLVGPPRSPILPARFSPSSLVEAIRAGAMRPDWLTVAGRLYDLLRTRSTWAILPWHFDQME